MPEKIYTAHAARDVEVSVLTDGTLMINGATYLFIFNLETSRKIASEIIGVQAKESGGGN
jgi:hypothetical protein